VETTLPKEKTDKPIIELQDATIRVGTTFLLHGTSWTIEKDQQWAVLGPNGAGKSSLVGALTGKTSLAQGKIIRRFPGSLQNPIGYVSLELQQRFIAKEEEQDEARFFSGQLDSFVKARDLILPQETFQGNEPPHFDRIAQILDLDRVMDRGIRFLSTGEMQKVLIARALVKSPRLLIMDEPFEGVDSQSRDRMAEIIVELMKERIQLILVTHRFEAVMPNVTHVLCIREGQVFLKGRREEVLNPENMERLYGVKKARTSDIPKADWGLKSLQREAPDSLLDLRNTTVKYGDLLVLDRLNWTMRWHENWAVLGPNGAGKTTLMSLVIGDNLQAYANEIYLFGKRRGTGESIWDIKKRIGVVSSELQVHYRARLKAYDVVLSGFHDSIGLYRRSSEKQRSMAHQWMEILGISDLEEKRFDHLSYGQRRMVLLARSMVKLPVILVLDEPCQGLDMSNRRMILDLVDYIGRETPTHVLYTTHHKDEIPPCITDVLKLKKPAQS
jgi:molybdate transport system ATP-binding protein